MTYTALVWAVAVMILSNAEPPWLFIAFAGFVVFLAGTLYLLYLLRCPRCRGAIGYVVSYGNSPFSVSPKIRFCPFCGVALDSEVENNRVV